ncbi:hypothetical protein BJV77DRAFT_1102887, partial [Russula vinacea]
CVLAFSLIQPSDSRPATNGVIALLVIIIFPSKFYYTCPTAILGKLYSNTLLVSLNNRISIREESAARGASPTSGVLAAPNFEAESSTRSSSVHSELEKSPQAFKGRKLSGDSEDEVQEKVIGGYCGTSFPNCLKLLVLIPVTRSHDLISQLRVNINYHDWIVIYFSTILYERLAVVVLEDSAAC